MLHTGGALPGMPAPAAGQALRRGAHGPVPGTGPVDALPGGRVVALDWSGASGCAPMPCLDCGRLAGLRDPATGVPRHKTCAERVAPAVEGVPAEVALGPERVKGVAKLAPYRPAQPFQVGRFRELLTVWPPDTHAVMAGGSDEVEGASEPEPDGVVFGARGVAEGDPLPRTLLATRDALEGIGWEVDTTVAAYRKGGQVRTSVALRCRRGGQRAYALWVAGKADGGQIQGVAAELGITAWKVACGVEPKAKGKAEPREVVDLQAYA
jgi:hypothetical protein